MKVIGKRSVASLVGLIINIAWYGQLVLYSFAGVVLLIAFIVKDQVVSDIPVTLRSYQTVSGLFTPNTALQNATLTLNAGLLHVEQKVTWQVILSAVGSFAGFAILGLLITYLLRQIFATLLREEPFVKENAHRLRKIALLIMLISPLRLLEDLYHYWFLTGNFKLANDVFAIDLVIDLQSLLTGLVLLIIAELFRLATLVKEENELTV